MKPWLPVSCLYHLHWVAQRYLVDNQLPAALAEYPRNRGFDSRHLFNIGLEKAANAEICRYALASDRLIISKDQDFLYLASPTKMKIRPIWVRLRNCRTSALLQASGSGTKSRQR